MSARTRSGHRARQFVKHLEEQGATVKRTSKGYLVHSPTGGSHVVHTTPGDVRAVKNEIAAFRRIGLHHPEDTKEIDDVVARNAEGYPLYITEGLRQSTRTRGWDELRKLGWPLRVRASEVPMPAATAMKVLYHFGYRWDPESPERNRVWVASKEIEERHKAQEAQQVRQQAVDELAAAIAPPPDPVGEAFNEWHGDEPDLERFTQVKGTPKPVSTPKPIRALPKKEEEREFIDSVDSWVIADGLPPEVQNYLRLLRGAGLEVEVRAWRK